MRPRKFSIPVVSWPNDEAPKRRPVVSSYSGCLAAPAAREIAEREEDDDDDDDPQDNAEDAPPFDDTRSLRPFDLIQELLANDEAPEGRHVGFLLGEPRPASRTRSSLARASLALSGHTLEADARGEAT